MTTNNIVWVVGESFSASKSSWTIQGVYSTEESAQKACFNEYCFIGPIELDKMYPENLYEWEGAYYPNYTGNTEIERIEELKPTDY